ENAESVFTLVEKIAKAQNFQETLTLQTEFARNRMQAFVTQTQQLFSGEAIQKSERGAHGTGTGALPSIPMVAGFKDVQDRAVEMVKKNAQSGFALVGKVAKAQNFQEIVTLQTRFAQVQMQAYATEMQELQRLMGETLQKLQRGSPS
ncbi:MAG: phasin family protein, partial [Rhodomicrobium sp.]